MKDNFKIIFKINKFNIKFFIRSLKVEQKTKIRKHYTTVFILQKNHFQIILKKEIPK